MLIKYFSNNFVHQLERSIAQNLPLYQGDSEWVTGVSTRASDIKDASLDISQIRSLLPPEGKSELHDSENAKIVYSDFRSINATQAMELRLWAYLCHLTYWDYMKLRWPPENESVIKRRYFFEGNNKDALVRNGISRLWWFGYLTYDEARDDHFELTDILLKNQDIQTGLLERGYGRNRQLLHATLDYIKAHYSDLEGGDGMSKNIQRLAKSINLKGAVTLLDVIDRKTLYRLFDESLSEIA